MEHTSGNDHFATPLQYLPGVGPKSAKKLARLGVETIGDLIWFFPRKYLDYSNISSIADIAIDNNQDATTKQIANDSGATIKAHIVGIANKKTRRRGFTVTEAVVEDGSGTIKVVWFNQPYLSQTLYTGREIILHGKVNWDHFNQTYVMESPDWADKPKIVPIYRETEGVTSYYIAKILSKVSEQISDIEEFLPQEIINGNNLLGINEAVRILHNPQNLAELNEARLRMAFDELFLISLRGQFLKAELQKKNAPYIEIEQSLIEKFIQDLPFRLTGDQDKAVSEVLSDLKKTDHAPMNRLLNGDVGSGKTIVAAIAAYAVAKCGYNTLIMAPTEILAKQHFESFNKIFDNMGMAINLITSKDKQIKEKTLNSGSIYIGTHALLHLKEPLENVALVVVDEQHRFGVNQRQALKEMTQGSDTPHFLSMTATPIPRSLQLVVFGELDVSLIEEKPANRKEIKTRVVDEAHRAKAYQFIRAHVKAGRQIFVITPLIEENQDMQPKNKYQAAELFDIDRKTVVGEYEKLSKEIFPDLRIGMLHGKMKAAEKDEIMKKFSSADRDILVSTSVVEVGVDIPNASVMMIEDAERFGLAQLHQFRGRVGRAEHQSFCFLFTSSQNPKALERLRGMENLSNGFELAELDLKNRGAGDIFGLDQSGFMDIKFANLADAVLIGQASRAAKGLIANDCTLKSHEKLKAKLMEFNSSKHFE